MNTDDLISPLLSYGSSLPRTSVPFPGVEGAGFTIPSLVLPLWLFVTGLLVILGVVGLVSLKFRRARTKHPGLPPQELAHFAGDKGEAHHQADERAGKPTEPKLASPRSQAATTMKGGRPQGYVPTPTGQHEDLLSCPNCGQFMPADATFCSHCGVLLVASESGQHLRLSIPPSPPLETSESSQDGTSLAQSGTSPVDVPQQSLQYSLPLPASSVSDEPAAQKVPNQPGNEYAHKAIPSSSHQEQPSTGLRVGAHSDPGITRQHRPNEDSLFVMQGMRTHTAPPQPFGVFIVADGMGGHKDGQEASKQAVQTMSDQLLPKLSESLELRSTELRKLLIDAVQAANRAIHQRNQEQRTDMGTTITAVVVVGLTAFVANVGDSRTYLYREPDGLRKITNDHSVVAYLVEAGIIKPDDIYTHSQRNQIYRSLGEKPLIQVDAFIEPLQPGDIVLLCSDGLWEMVRDPAIQQILRSGTGPSQMTSALIEAALDGGGADNVSVIVVHVTESHIP